MAKHMMTSVVLQSIRQSVDYSQSSSMSQKPNIADVN